MFNNLKIQGKCPIGSIHIETLYKVNTFNETEYKICFTMENKMRITLCLLVQSLVKKTMH